MPHPGHCPRKAPSSFRVPGFSQDETRSEQDDSVHVHYRSSDVDTCTDLFGELSHWPLGRVPRAGGPEDPTPCPAVGRGRAMSFWLP